jgi:hypothetical protein
MSEESTVRKNARHITDDERVKLRDAFIDLNTQERFRFPGSRNDKPFAGGVSYWFKQDEIHQATHVHGGPAFLTWHRELCNRFERLLRMADKKVSLHYWDWNEDPKDLFIPEFMGSSQGEAGQPWLNAGYYNPYPLNDNYRAEDASDIDHTNPADPPLSIRRDKKEGTLREYVTKAGGRFYTDEEIIESENYSEMRLRLERVHNAAHNYIGGTIGDPHISFRDPFVFLIHSNVDRLFAAWQLRKGKEFEYRLDPDRVYGYEKDTEAKGSTSPFVLAGIRTMLSPWCGIGYPYDHRKRPNSEKKEEPGVSDVRPWTYPENWHRDPSRPEEKLKDSLDPSIVMPPPYDKIQVLSSSNQARTRSN